jgi:hypothetical protein
VEEEEPRGEDDQYGDTSRFLDPEVPAPHVTQPGEEWLDGWHSIDQIGCWDCYLSLFSTLENVPLQHQVMWTRAWATVLEREASAESELDKERALKWFCFLAQGLLRTPRRGGRMGKGAIQACFLLWQGVNGADW